MQSYRLKIYPVFYNVCIFGDMQHNDDMVWNSETIGMSAASIMIPTPPSAEEELFSVKIVVANDFSAMDDVFFKHVIRTDSAGIKITEVEESDLLEIQDGSDGNTVQIMVPWESDQCLLHFRAPDGFCENEEGVAMPNSLEILVSPVPD